MRLVCTSRYVRINPSLLKLSIRQRHSIQSGYPSGYGSACGFVRTGSLSWRCTFSSSSSSSSSTGGKPLASPGKLDEKQPLSTIRNVSDTTSGISDTSDPPVATWVQDCLPTSWQPYARLARMDKPIGTMLLLWPCAWSTALAAPAGGLPDPYLLSLFATGAFVMRGAGCTINDLWDRDIDARVQRTSTRPLANGEVTVKQAYAFLAGQMATGCAVLVSLPHTWYCFQWGVASLPFVFLYPSMKRFFPYPQAFLGLTFNWGAWMGWAATYGSMDWSLVAPLYASGVTWTLVYDTIYAHQDKDDDAQLGLESTALTFGADESTQKRILHGLAAATAGQWLWVGYQADLASVYTLGVAAAYGHLVWQIQTADFCDPHNLATRFRSNNTVGGMLFGALAAGTYLA